MRLTLWCALQLALTVPQSASLTVRVGDKVRSVPVVAQTGGPKSLRADLLAEALGGQLVAVGAARYRMVVGARGVEFDVGVPWAHTDSTDLPLVSPPYRVDGRLYVPLAMATELLPRVFANLLYDDNKDELRRLAIVSAARGAVAQPEPSRPTARIPRGGVTAGATASSATSSSAVRKRIVVVDAGHGGPDNGMTGPLGSVKKVREKDITLAVAIALQHELAARGVQVVMTRSTDTLIALGDRGKIANTAKGDVFLSVHVNAANPNWSKPGTARGFETYFLAEAKTEDEKRVEAMENESIRFETSAETSRDDPLGFIIRDMAQNEHLRESSTLADLILRRLKTMHPGPSRGVKQAGFSVLVHAFMPAVLVEIGFGSNAAESAYMTDPAHQGELASAIADATMAYLLQYERKVGSGIQP
jgi:N-acetylmuramoyl-L-alanine amidase